MAYKNNWATGELIDATAFQELVNSAVYSFANLTAIQNNITSPIDGQIAFAQDTELYHRYDADSTSWVALLGGADITAVTITTASGSGLAVGSTSSSGAFQVAHVTYQSRTSQSARTRFFWAIVSRNRDLDFFRNWFTMKFCGQIRFSARVTNTKITPSRVVVSPVSSAPDGHNEDARRPPAKLSRVYAAPRRIRSDDKSLHRTERVSHRRE